MKICFVLGHFYPYVGGAEKMFLELATGLVNEGHEVRVITSNTENGDNYIEYMGISIYYYPWKNFLGHPIVKKKDLISHIEWCDIVHTAVYTVAPAVRKVANKYNKKVVLTVYEAIGKKWYWVENVRAKAFALSIFEKFVVEKKYTVTHAISGATKRDLEYFRLKNPVRMIYCPVKEAETICPELSQKNRSKKTFLYYGRPGQTKGVFVYLEAIEILAEKLEDKWLSEIQFDFVLADEPKEQRDLFVKRVKDKKLESLILIRKALPREELNQTIYNADYVVVPSITEGFGYSAIEACDMGKKLICSDAGSLPEVIYGNCLLFKNRQPQDLAEKLISVIKGEIEFEWYPKKDFSLKTVVNQMETLYRECMEEKNM